MIMVWQNFKGYGFNVNFRGHGVDSLDNFVGLEKFIYLRWRG